MQALREGPTKGAGWMRQSREIHIPFLEPRQSLDKVTAPAEGLCLRSIT